MNYTAADLYGGTPSPQPTSTATPDHAPGTPPPMARTTSATGGRSPVMSNPTLMLVILVGAAIGLVHISVNLGK